MIFLVNNSNFYYLPFFSFNGHEYQSPFYAILLILELILTILSCTFTIQVCRTVWKVRVYHINMTIITNFYFLQYFELVLGKALMAFYQYGYFRIAGVPKSQHYIGWASTEIRSVPRVHQFSDAWPMFVGGFLIWHYMMQMVFFIFFYCLERVVATLLLGSYEKHSRSYISISILITANLVTLLVTYSLFTTLIDFISSVIICSSVVIVSVILYIATLLVNVKINNDLKNDTIEKRKKKFDKYSLAYRFQLEENLKAFNLARQVIVWIGVYIVLNILIIFLINLNLISASWNLILVFVMENCIYLNPLLICSVTVCAVQPWRQAVGRDLGAFGAFARLNRVGSEKSILVSEASAVDRVPTHQKETDIYFRDLNAMWA